MNTRNELQTAFDLLSNKIGSPDQYYIVQTIYNGWRRLAYCLALQFASIAAVIFLVRSGPRVRTFAVVALLGRS